MTPANASFLKSNFKNVVKNNNLKSSATYAIVVKDRKTSKILYQNNKDMLLNPASILKLLTFGASIDVLGADYNFETAFYVQDNDLYLKLGADPHFTSADLNNLVKDLNLVLPKFNNLYIDDTTISDVAYPMGWTSDDYLFEIPPISPYIINSLKGIVHLNLSPDKSSVRIVQNGRYRFSFINELEINNDQMSNIKLYKTFEPSQEVIIIRGTISDDEILQIPVANPKAVFISYLRQSFSKYKIPYTKQIGFKVVPKNAKKLVSFKTPIANVAKSIMYSSDNYNSEILFRVAANKYAVDRNLPLKNGEKSHGTFENGILMFSELYGDICDFDKQKIADASGLSRYNALSADFISNALLKLDKKMYIWRYAILPNEGTLKKRLRYYQNNLRAKTGTLKGLSSLAGKMTTQKGQDVVFVMIIQDLSRSTSALKAIEDDFVDCIFKL